VTGTIAGVVGVVSYNPPQLNSAIASAQKTPQPVDTPVTDTPSQTKNSPAQPASTKSTSTASSKTNSSTNSTTTDQTSPSPTPTQSTKQSAGVSGTFKGDTSQTRWGPVQVQVTLTNGKITDVTTLQYPNGDRKSLNISNQVIPWLQEETLQVQSANISGISGATYTSMGFQSSLASALQKAGM
jgi:uncharacterized protein with FMN-binding domain